MSGRVWVGVGTVVTLLVSVGLIVYIVAVGLDEAVKLGSVVSAIVGLAGLAATFYGMQRGKREAANRLGDNQHRANPGGTYNTNISGSREFAVGDQARVSTHPSLEAPPGHDAPAGQAAASDRVALEAEVTALRSSVAKFDPGAVPRELRQRLTNAEAALQRLVHNDGRSEM